jgi:hypothetical protein
MLSIITEHMSHASPAASDGTSALSFAYLASACVAHHHH